MDPGIPNLGISDYSYLDLLTIWQGMSYFSISQTILGGPWVSELPDSVI